MILSILDLETTGLDGLPNDRIVQIGLLQINLDTNKTIFEAEYNVYEPEHEEKYQEAWIFQEKHLLLQDWLNKQNNFKYIVKKIQEKTRNTIIASFNVGFDLGKFLYQDPFYLRTMAKGRLMDPMVFMGWECAGGKWAKLTEAYQFVTKQTLKQKHTALEDVKATWEVIQWMIQTYPEKIWYKNFKDDKKYLIQNGVQHG